MPLDTRHRIPRRSLWTYLALAFGLSWLFWIPAAISGQDVTTSAWVVAYLLGGFGPSAAGALLVTLQEDAPTQRHYWRRVVEFGRISPRWYLFIALVFPAVFGLALLVSALLGAPASLETLSRLGANPAMLLSLVLFGLIAGPISEELGWRGYALDRLQARWRPLRSGLILSAIWWAWHLPLFAMRGTAHNAWGLGSASFWTFTLAAPALSVLLTWVYNHNRRSMLAAILLHFAYTLAANLVSPLPDAALWAHVGWLYLATAAVVAVRPGGR